MALTTTSMRAALAADDLTMMSGPSSVDFGFQGLADEAASNWFGTLQFYFKLTHFQRGAALYGASKWAAMKLAADDGCMDGDYYEANVRVTKAADIAIHMVVITGQLVPTMLAAAAADVETPYGKSLALALKVYLDLCSDDGTLDHVHSATDMYRI